jgi:hypothetical protein
MRQRAVDGNNGCEKFEREKSKGQTCVSAPTKAVFGDVERGFRIR